MPRYGAREFSTGFNHLPRNSYLQYLNKNYPVSANFRRTERIYTPRKLASCTPAHVQRDRLLSLTLRAARGGGEDDVAHHVARGVGARRRATVHRGHLLAEHPRLVGARALDGVAHQMDLCAQQP